jgi:hypothetical protein
MRHSQQISLHLLLLKFLSHKTRERHQYCSLTIQNSGLYSLNIQFQQIPKLPPIEAKIQLHMKQLHQ